jgi:hypothetical protein
MLSASGFAIENLAGDDVEKLAAPVQTARLKRRGRKASPHFSGSSSPRDLCAIGYSRRRRPADASDLPPKGMGALRGGAALGFAPVRLQPRLSDRLAHSAMQLAIACEDTGAAPGRRDTTPRRPDWSRRRPSRHDRHARRDVPRSQQDSASEPRHLSTAGTAKMNTKASTRNFGLSFGPSLQSLHDRYGKRPRSQDSILQAS